MYMLDTDMLIFMVRGLRKTCRNAELTSRASLIRDRLRVTQDSGNAIGISAITACELEYGCCKADDPRKEQRAVSKLLAPFDILSLDPLLAPRHYGAIRHSLERAGIRIGAMDLLIAAHARAIDATLVTNNHREFSRVEGLACENWLRDRD
jgi:tRNA(fMet)-specific endonuclease VapC